MKAIAAHTIFIVGAILIFVFFLTVLLFGYIDSMDPSPFTCSAKVTAYCSDWQKTGYTNTPWNWDKKEPKDCGDPPSIDDCKKLFP